jgi:uncharacterized protein YjbI with pentapeptide repeats
VPWVSVREPFASPPRQFTPPHTRPIADAASDIEVLHGRAYITGIAFDGDATVIATYDDVELDSCALTDLSIGGEHTPELSAHRCAFDSCDLSRSRFRELRQCRITGSKLTGADLSGAEIIDVVFERCMLHLAQLRMARLQRVRFSECVLREVDGFELVAEDVAFDGSDLERVNLDRLRGVRVDLRDARSLSFDGVGRLDGCLIADHQVHDLAYELAFAVGLGIEPTERPET